MQLVNLTRLLYTLQNIVLWGVYCFQPFRDSVNIIRICYVTEVALARFCSNFHHTLTIRHCMFCRKKGAKGSVLQELCHFVILTKMFTIDSAYFVKSTAPRAFSIFI